MMKILPAFMLVILSYGGFAQAAADPLKPFYFLEGVWKGNGWTSLDGLRQKFRETETISIKLAGALIQLEAYGVASNDSSKIINDALGLLRYNEEKENYELAIYQSGSYSLAQVRLVAANELEWTLQISPSLKIKYTIKVSGDNWYEAGYTSSDDINWQKYFEMELKKVK